MSAQQAGRHLWTTLHEHLRGQDVAYWWPLRWEGLPRWLQQELEALSRQWAARQDEGQQDDGTRQH